jgi:hypothetical protein
MADMGGSLPKSVKFNKWYIDMSIKYSLMTTKELLEVVFKWAEPNEGVLYEPHQYFQYEFEYVKNLLYFRLQKAKAFQ